LVVTVHLHTTLRRKAEQGMQGRLELELESGATVASVLERLDIPADDEALLLVINRRMATPDQPLVDGDEVRLIPAIAGG